MKYGLLKVVGLSSLLLFTGCQANDTGDESAFFDSGDGIVNVDDRNEDFNNVNITSMEDPDIARFGYVRMQKRPIAQEENFGSRIPYAMDREKAAYAISKNATLIPHVYDVATLITDEEILVAYETDSENRFEVADQVKLTALNYVPGWYNVYVSDEEGMIKEIENFSQLNSTTQNVDSYMQSTIERMLKSPQGRKIDNRDENNRSMDEMQDDLDKMNNQNREYDRYDIPNHEDGKNEN